MQSCRMWRRGDGSLASLRELPRGQTDFSVTSVWPESILSARLLARMNFPLSVPSMRVLGALVVVSLPVLFGGVPFPAGAWIAVAVGALWLMAPPRFRPGRFWFFAFGAMAFLPLLALLPLGAWDHSIWRREVAGFLPAEKFTLLTPQPMLLLWTLPAFYAGLMFAIWVFASNWEQRERRWLICGLGVFWIVVAVVLVMQKILDLPLLSHSASGLGLFPSRNQTGLFLAIGAIWCLSIADFSFQRLQVAGGIVWSLGCGLLVWLAFVNGSRSGLAFSGIGMVLYFLLAGSLHRRPGALLVGGVFLVAGIFSALMLRGDTSWRFGEVSTSGIYAERFRMEIQRDAIELIKDTPLVGVGLGNFDAVFPFYRERSQQEFRAKHAENDWLQLAAECGIPILLIAAAMIAGLMFQGMFKPRSTEAIAVWIAGVFIVIHGFLDQSLHCPEILFPAFLMLSLAAPPDFGVVAYRRLEWSRIAACMLILLACACIVMIKRSDPSAFAVDGFDYTPAADMKISDIDEALDFAPLAWHLHELRGHLLARDGKAAEALNSFRAARRLEPFALGPGLREANTWLRTQVPSYALEAAGEVVRRAPSSRNIYFEYTETFLRYPGLSNKWLATPESRLDLELVRMLYLSTDQARAKFAGLKASGAFGKPLSDVGEQRLIILAFKHLGGAKALDEASISPKPQNWISAARILASQGDMSAACGILLSKVPAPSKNDVPSVELQRRFFASPDDTDAALRLVDSYLREGSVPSADRVLATLDGKNSQVSYYSAWITVLRGDYASAWVLFENYLNARPR